MLGFDIVLVYTKVVREGVYWDAMRLEAENRVAGRGSRSACRERGEQRRRFRESRFSGKKGACGNSLGPAGRCRLTGDRRFAIRGPGIGNQRASDSRAITIYSRYTFYVAFTADDESLLEAHYSSDLRRERMRLPSSPHIYVNGFSNMVKHKISLNPVCH